MLNFEIESANPVRVEPPPPGDGPAPPLETAPLRGAPDRGEGALRDAPGEPPSHPWRPGQGGEFPGDPPLPRGWRRPFRAVGAFQTKKPFFQPLPPLRYGVHWG